MPVDPNRIKALLRPPKLGSPEWVEVFAQMLNDHLPEDADHESAINVRRYIARARKATTEIERVNWMRQAEVHLKDFLLYDDAVAHEATREGAKHGHELVHGTDAEKQKNWAEYQAFIDKRHGENSHLSYEQITLEAAAKFEVSQKTIKRHTKNWK